MNKLKRTSSLYRYGPAMLLSLFLASGCSGVSEKRYDGSKSYTMAEAGNTFTIGQYENGTAPYSNGPAVDKYTTGQYDQATAHYTLRQGWQNTPNTEGVQIVSGEERETTVAIVIDVDGVLFEFDKSVIRESFYPVLDQWVGYFQSNRMVSAAIHGHTDSVGTELYNQKLSEKRAQAVLNYLTKNGVETQRLAAKGFGESQPVASNKTKEGRQENRRVEVNF